MSDFHERRRWKRIPIREEVLLYIRDGEKRETETVNISGGGLLLKSPELLPIGTQLAVVFKKQKHSESPIFLIGRVVRVQEAPIKGFAIQWEKAVSSCSRLEMSLFLVTTFGFDDPFIKQKKLPGSNKVMSVYIFDTIQMANIDIKTQNSDKLTQEFDIKKEKPKFVLMQEQKPPKLKDTVTPIVVVRNGEEFKKLSKKRELQNTGKRRYADTASSEGEDSALSSSAGPITRELTVKELTVPVYLKSKLWWNENSVIDVFIYRIGYNFVQVQSPVIPPEEIYTLNLQIPIKKERLNDYILCRCHVVKVKNIGVKDKVGIDMRIIETDEQGNEGAFDRFIKSLVFIQLAQG
jgi:hypothetical protein